LHQSDALLRIRGAARSFTTPEGGTVAALAGVDLDVRPNEFLTLLGPSGCGKTTLLRAIAGFEALDAGELQLEGRPLAGLPPYRRPFNTVFQSYALFPHLSVADNVGYGLDVARVPRAERDGRVREALALVGLQAMERRKPRQLSGGQQQRVALARALVNRPRLLLLDEPLSALDRSLRQAMQIELKNLQHQVGITFLVVTHDQEEALVMSDRIAVMNAGRIQQIGAPGEVYDRPANRFVASFIGNSNLFSGTVEAETDGTVVVATDSGLRLRARATSFRRGERVEAMLRPEQLDIATPDPALPGLEATVENVVFVGADRQVIARLGDGGLVKVLRRHVAGAVDPGERIGARVTLRYAPEAVHLMRGGA